MNHGKRCRFFKFYQISKRTAKYPKTILKHDRPYPHASYLSICDALYKSLFNDIRLSFSGEIWYHAAKARANCKRPARNLQTNKALCAAEQKAELCRASVFLNNSLTAPPQVEGGYRLSRMIKLAHSRPHWPLFDRLGRERQPFVDNQAGHLSLRPPNFFKKSREERNQMPLILCVDDEPGQLDLYQFFFERVGFQVQVAKNGPEAIEQTQILAPDLILMALMMPIKDGYQVSLEIKADPHLHTFPSS
jgi:hypothetical protein